MQFTFHQDEISLNLQLKYDQNKYLSIILWKHPILLHIYHLLKK